MPHRSRTRSTSAQTPGKESGIEFRIGIHVGDIIFYDDDIFGDGVTSSIVETYPPTIDCLIHDLYPTAIWDLDKRNPTGPPAFPDFLTIVVTSTANVPVSSVRAYGKLVARQLVGTNVQTADDVSVRLTHGFVGHAAMRES